MFFNHTIQKRCIHVRSWCEQVSFLTSRRGAQPRILTSTSASTSTLHFAEPPFIWMHSAPHAKSVSWRHASDFHAVWTRDISPSNYLLRVNIMNTRRRGGDPTPYCMYPGVLVSALSTSRTDCAEYRNHRNHTLEYLMLYTQYVSCAGIRTQNFRMHEICCRTTEFHCFRVFSISNARTYTQTCELFVFGKHATTLSLNWICFKASWSVHTDGLGFHRNVMFFSAWESGDESRSDFGHDTCVLLPKQVSEFPFPCELLNSSPPPTPRLHIGRSAKNRELILKAWHAYALARRAKYTGSE